MSDEAQASDYNLVYNTFKEIGCCDVCCLRFIGEKNSSSFLNIKETLKSKNIDIKEEEFPPSKILKTSACVTCLGLLQKPYCDGIIEKVLEDLKTDYDCNTFNIALNVPVALELRAHSMFLQIQSEFASFCDLHFSLGLVTVSVKDVWKWIYTPIISQALSKDYFSSSDFTITVSLHYPDETKECSCLFAMDPNQFSKTKNRKNQGSQNNFSRKSVISFLETIESETFTKQYPVPPTVPNYELIYYETTSLHNSLFIGGRYNKFSRVLPQTPWILNGKRKVESSVEELISEPMKAAIKAADNKFSASGREDVDVRALGRGRPFYVELIDPHITKLDYAAMRKLENEINTAANGAVYVRYLQFVPKKDLEILKEGEEKKTKQYRALCILLDSFQREECEVGLARLSSKFPLTLEQSTPIRVLHRRAVAVRQKTIHWLQTTPLQEDKDFFTVTLNTQAGTYIKEFIHGDFGRTTPSLGELLGGVDVDILALDVMDVLLDWPPNSGSGSH